MTKFALAAAAAFAAAFTATPALAEDVSVAVPYADLDIATPAGADRLAQRIVVSVDNACEAGPVRNVKVAAMVHACRSAMLANAATQLASKGADLAANSLTARI